MSHNIFGERALVVGEPAWHKIGKVLETPVPAVEGLKMIDADFDIVKSPLMVQVNTLFGTNMVPYPGKYALVREPVEGSLAFDILGNCGDDYEIVQRRDFAKAVDKLTGRWPLETIGVLGRGETVFFTLDAGPVDVGGEEVHQYFLVHDRVDGKTSAKIAFTPVRVVCQNTLTSGLSQATMSAVIDHRTGIGQDVNFRIDLINKMAEAQRLTINTFEMLAHTRLIDDQVDDVFAAAYPYPSRPKKMELAGAIDVTDELLSGLRGQGLRAVESYEYYCKRADGFRTAARMCYDQMNDKNPALAGSAWYAWQAVTEMADWRDGAESVPVSTLFGQRMQEKVRAFNVASSFIK